MTVPQASGLGSNGPVASVAAELPSNRLPPAAWASRSRATCCRSAGSPSQARSRYASRSAGEGSSTAPRKISRIRSKLEFMVGSSRDRTSHTQCGKGAGSVSNPRSFLAEGVLSARGVAFAGHLAAEPGAGEGHLAIGGGPREAEDFAGLFDAQPGEVMQLDELAAEGVVAGEAVQGLVQGEEVIRRGEGDGLGLLEVAAAVPPASLLGALATGAIDEDPAHGLGRSGEEVAPAVPPPGLLGIDQPEIRLVHQRGRLERLAGPLLGQPLGRQLAELVVDQREQLLARPRLPVFDGREDASDVVRRRGRSPRGPGWSPSAAARVASRLDPGARDGPSPG